MFNSLYHDNKKQPGRNPLYETVIYDLHDSAQDIPLFYNDATTVATALRQVWGAVAT
jgi:hypothetical protein